MSKTRMLFSNNEINQKDCLNERQSLYAGKAHKRKQIQKKYLSKKG